MKAPIVKRIKVYAIVESIVDKPCEPEELDTFLSENSFTGATAVNYNQGGITNIITKQHISMSMSELDTMLAARSKQ